MRTDGYSALAMVLLAGTGGLIIYISRKLKFKAVDLSTVKMWLIQVMSLLFTAYGGGLLDGSYSVFGYILLIIAAPVLIFSTTVLMYRLFTGKLYKKK